MERYIKHFKAMDAECFRYCKHIGFLRAAIDRKDFAKAINEAENNLVIQLGSAEIIRGLVLYCSRMLDRSRDAISLVRLSADPSPEDIEAHHTARKQQQGMRADAYDTTDQLEALDRLKTHRRTLTKMHAQKSIKEYRDTRLAHLLDRDAKVEAATLGELLEISELIVSYISDVALMIDCARGQHEERIAAAEAEAAAFFDGLKAE